MTQYIFRLATPADRPSIHHLQEQFLTEMNDPLGVVESDFARSEFLLVDAITAHSRRTIGMTSILHASSAPFIFERVFPDVWQRIDVPTLTGREELRRDDLVELDWGYVERPHRGRQLALLMLSGALLHVHRKGYPMSVGIANAAALNRMPPGVFCGTGMARMLGGFRYELGTLSPDQSVPLMAGVVQEASARDRMVAWHMDVS